MCRPTNDSWHLLKKSGENGKLLSLDNSATHQEPTENEIINDLNSLKINFINNLKPSKTFAESGEHDVRNKIYYPHYIRCQIRS